MLEALGDGLARCRQHFGQERDGRVFPTGNGVLYRDAETLLARQRRALLHEVEAARL
ncbi:hypothetical protein D9M68_921110 [compost metagenome]